MDAAAVLHVKTRLASLKHQSALTTEQFVLLKDKAKQGLVTDQVFENVSQAWNVGKALDKWLLDADHVELWESNKLTVSQRRILITQWVGEAAKTIDVEMAVDYRRRLFEKTGLAITADGSDDKLINLESMQGEFSFMDADSTPEPLEDVLPSSPAPADEEHPPGSSDDEDDSDEEGGESNSGANDELATLDVDDDLDEGEEPLPLEIPTGYVLANSAPAALTAALVKRPIMLRLGVGWRVAQGDHHAAGSSAHPPSLRLQSFVDRDGSTHSVKLPLTKYSVNGSSGEGSWALLECLAQAGGSDKESQEGAGEGYEDEDEEEDEEEDGVNVAEAVERPKGKSRAKRKRVVLREGVESTARFSSRACMPNVRLTDQ